EEQRRLHKAFLRYHDPKSWPIIREALNRMGRSDLIGDGKNQLVPAQQPNSRGYHSARRKNSTPARDNKGAGPLLTQHTGLPPRDKGDKVDTHWHKREQARAAAEAKLRAERWRGSRPRGGQRNTAPSKPS